MHSDPQTLMNELGSITKVVERLVSNGIQIREIRLHGRARPAIVLHRPPPLSGNTYAWGTDQRGRHYERQAYNLSGVQLQWETRPSAPRPSNVVPFPITTESKAVA